MEEETKIWLAAPVKGGGVGVAVLLQVLLAAEEPRAISARNVLAGEVGAVTVESQDSRLVELITEAGTVLSRVTPEAAQDLALVPGMQAWALVKAHAI